MAIQCLHAVWEHFLRSQNEKTTTDAKQNQILQTTVLPVPTSYLVHVQKLNFAKGCGSRSSWFESMQLENFNGRVEHESSQLAFPTSTVSYVVSPSLFYI